MPNSNWWDNPSFLPGAQTGQGSTSGLAGINMDPYSGYGSLLGAPGSTGTPKLAAFAPNTSPTGGAGGGDIFRPNRWWNPDSSPTEGPPGAPTSEGNITYSPVGSMEELLDKLFRGSITGRGGGPIGRMLFNLGLGRLPPVLSEQIIGQTNESFGKMGARFGTDLGTAQARGLAQAAAAQSLNAIQQILGLGGTTAGFQFSRGESAMERALREFLQQQQMDPLNDILGSLL